LKYLIDFIEKRDISKAKIFSHLKCTKEEAELIQYICRRYVKGEDDISVIDILQESYIDDDYTYLKKLPLMKRILS